MIVSRTPPPLDSLKASTLNAKENAKKLQSPNLTLPFRENPRALLSSHETDLLSSSSEALTSRGLGGPLLVRLHPRRFIESDERDKSNGAHKYGPASGIPHTPVPYANNHRKNHQIIPTNHHNSHHMLYHPASVSSWTTISSSGPPGSAAWCRHIRTNRDGMMSAAIDRGTVSLSPSDETRKVLSRSTYLPSPSRKDHNNQCQRAKQSTDHRLVSRQSTFASTGNSIHTRHYKTWQRWNTQPEFERSFVQQSYPRSELHKQLYPTVQYVHHGVSGALQNVQCTPPKCDNGEEKSCVDSNENSNHKNELGGKRELLPQQQHCTPLFKKAKGYGFGFDKLDLLCSATLEIGELHDNPTGCSCPKSKCVALYCDCFKAGRRCNPARCSCLDCKNTIAESGINGARTKAIRCILSRNPRAFRTAGEANMKFPPGEIACNCVRSRCLQLYCSCFHNGKACKAGVCTCVGCYNSDADSEGHRKAAIEQALQKRPDAFDIKIKEKGLGCACKNNRCIKKYCDCFRTSLACTDKCSCRQCENHAQA